MRTFIDTRFIEPGQTVVVGLSGGPDSVCLLYELKILGNPVICAHVNHGLRGEEANGDEAYVRELCARLKVPLEVRNIDAAALAKELGQTIEEAGREARYAFFDELCEKITGELIEDDLFCMPAIAVGHNMDDQIETVMMRIMRGTGIDGLAGIAPRRKSAMGFDILRPLLAVPREKILMRLSELKVTAREDTSNKETEYFRNKIRLEIIPWLESATDFNLRQSLLRLAENAAEDKDYFDAVICEALDDESGEVVVKNELAGNEKGGSFCFPAEILAGSHPAIRHRLIRAVFAELGLTRDVAAVHLAAADNLLRTWQDGREASGKRVEFPFDFTFGIQGKNAVFRTPDTADPGWKPRRGA